MEKTLNIDAYAFKSRGKFQGQQLYNLFLYASGNCLGNKKGIGNHKNEYKYLCGGIVS